MSVATVVFAVCVALALCASPSFAYDATVAAATPSAAASPSPSAAPSPDQWNATCSDAFFNQLTCNTSVSMLNYTSMSPSWCRNQNPCVAPVPLLPPTRLVWHIEAACCMAAAPPAPSSPAAPRMRGLCVCDCGGTRAEWLPPVSARDPPFTLPNARGFALPRPRCCCVAAACVCAF